MINIYFLNLSINRLPARPDSLQNVKQRSSNSDSISSSTEYINTADEPYYDMVAPEDEYNSLKSNHSSTENVFSSSSTLPLGAKRESTQTVQEPQSPGTSNYVNIEYFIQYVEYEWKIPVFMLNFL